MLPTDQFLINWACDQLSPAKVTVHAEQSGDNSTVYELRSESNRWFLKIGANLTPEYERLKWLAGRASVPSAVAFLPNDERDALLSNAIEGRSLAYHCKTWAGDDVASKLADALRSLHGTETSGCPFGTPAKGLVLVHGDACLPNVLFSIEGSLTGFVDMGELTIGDIEIDLSAAVWSLQYNMGPGYGLPFLKSYGIENASDAMVERLRLKYQARD